MAVKTEQGKDGAQLTVQEADRLMSLGPVVRDAVKDLEQVKELIMADDGSEGVDRSMTVIFNVVQHAQLERVAAYYMQSKTSVASKLLSALIVDLFNLLDLPDLTPQEIADYMRRTVRKKEAL